MPDNKLTSEILKVELDDATFKGTGEVIEPTYVNYFFGNNGTGKSTIARTIMSGEGVTYAAGKKYEDYITLVYNQAFIDRNIRSDHRLDGVYTINEVNVEIQQQIDEKEVLRADAAKKSSDAETLQHKKESEREEKLKAFQKECMDKTADLRERFAKTQEGKKRGNKFVEEVRKHPPVEHDLDQLALKCDAAYSESAKHYDRFKVISDPFVLDALDGKEILSVVIANAAQTELAKFLEEIGATEWFRAGHTAYHENAGGRCPYCRSKLQPGFEKEVADSFDDRYEKNLKMLDSFLNAYIDTSERLKSNISSIPAEIYPAIDIKPFNDKLSAARGVIAENIELIVQKKADPAQTVTLIDTAPVLQELSDIIGGFNELIDTNNAVVDAGPKKRDECRDQVFEHMAFVLKDMLEEYDSKDSALVQEINTLKDTAEKQSRIAGKIEGEISDLRSRTVDTESAIKNINTMLRDAGFQGFEVRPHKNPGDAKITSYEVVRTETGKLAENLSEGEKNFIAFLYFQQRVFGRDSAAGDNRKKIVVIDDPVSSMDSGTLFIVGDQIRKMIEICRNNADSRQANIKGNFIKQIFILTHNAYFHREIAYLYPNRYEFVSFYLVKKSGNKSSVKLMRKRNPDAPTEWINVNPVKNSYAALWEEYKALKETASTVSVLNVIRRILEYYFLQICGYDSSRLRKVVLEDNKDEYILRDSEGKEDYTRFDMARAMLSYIAGSTYGINDGFHYVDDIMDMEQCRTTFQMIFHHMGQDQHYDMMMRV